MIRKITESDARVVLKVLIEECGYRVLDPHDGEAFVSAIVVPQPEGRGACTEYRFCGELGSGGKFRNNGNKDCVPYVDCYPENETPARLAMIDNANKRLAEIFPAKN